MVSKVVMASAGRAAGVEYVDRRTGARHRVSARAVILAAGTCETTRLLLNSGDTPGGLANSSGQLGRNLTDSTGASFRAFGPALAGRPPSHAAGHGGPHNSIPLWPY